MNEKRGRLVLVLGGARSGKSSFALRQANACPGRKVYIATAQAFDAEMQERIGNHQKERGSEWDAIEEPLLLSGAVESASRSHEVVIVDCLTLWLSNLMFSDKDPEQEMQLLLSSLASDRTSQIYVVSNELGMGIVPENALARRFRDLAGKLNQMVAAAAAEVYLVVAGIPVKIK